MNDKYMATMSASTVQESDGSLLFRGFSIGNSDGGASSVHYGGARENGTGEPASLRLVHQSSSTRVYRHGRDGGVKVFLNRDQPWQGAAVSHETTHSHIERERRITNDVLPQSLATRRVTRIAPFDGCPSFRFEWVEGISLKEWIVEAAAVPEERDLPRQAAVDRRARLRMATAVARAVGDYHDASVAHNKISTSNIIVEATAGGHYSAVLIDLSRATVLTGGGADGRRPSSCQNDEGEAQRNDLKDLGRVFYELFYVGEQQMHDYDSIEALERATERQYCLDGDLTAIEMDDGKTVSRRKRERRATDTDADLPTYLSALISALVCSCCGGNEFGELYNTAKDAMDDLKVAASKYDIYFPSPKVMLQSEKSRLLLHRDVFYGRKSEVAMLMQTFDSVARGAPSIVTAISGPAGMGKTSLANQIETPLKERNGRLIRAKFDQNARQPESILFSAIDSFLGKLADEGNAVRLELQQRITGTLGPGISILRVLVPNLGEFVPSIMEEDDNDDDQVVTATTRQQRSQISKYLLCSLIRVLCTPKTPLVLLIDDLQWADKTSLDLVQQILVDREILYCYCIVSYRDDDAMLTPLVSDKLDAIRTQGVSVQTIGLGPIEKESAVMLISEALCLPPSLSRPLSSLLHRKTGGAALFITKFLQTLNKDGLIRLNLSTRRWDYDLKSICTTVIPPDVVQFLTMQMTKLGHFQCLALKVAACLGSNSFDLMTFTKAKVVNNMKLEEQLSTLTASGFIHAISSNKFMWAHDTVRQAAYELIPPSKREMFHLLIGTKILINTTSKQLEDSIFDIVSQMMAGKEYLQSDSQKYEVAELNLIAGRRTLKTFTFNSAAAYLLSGIKLLPDDCWEQEYNLSLNLHDAAIDALYAVGDPVRVRDLVSKTLANANIFKDKLNAHQHRILLLKSTGLATEAVPECLFVIGELGEELPSEQVATEALVAAEFTHVKNILMAHSEEDILRLRVMNDSRKVATMDFLQMLISSSGNTQFNLIAIAVFRMIKLSIEWGLCDTSAFAFATYGGFLCKTQDYEGAYRFGKVAVKLLNRLSLKAQNRVKARVYTVVVCVINIFREPYQASLDKLLDGYRSGCQYGDLEFAFYCLQRHSVIQLHAGGNLIKLKQEMTSAVKKAWQYGQVTATILILPWLSFVIEMTGDTSCKDPYKTYLSCTEHALLALQESRTNFGFCHLLCNKKKIVFVFNGDIDGAAQYYTRSLKYPRESTPSTGSILSTFADGLIAFTQAQKHDIDEEQWTNIAVGVIAIFYVWVKNSSWNFSHKLLLLEAEHHVLKGNNALAVEKYNLSITTARKHRYVHEEGLGLERAGDYHISQGRTDTALLCYSSAKKCFERWGACAVADRIAEKCRRF